jgi:2-amino-4-hydroxy-6-hydroxymethyldihydropteridine diphosphokinase
MSITCYIALGSNLGDRQAYLDQAVALLRAQSGIRVEQVSRSWETAPVGGPADQGPFLNAAARLDTDLSPRAVLNALLTIERQLGRERREPCGPRTIDLDLLLYGAEVLDEPELVVPHPRMHERVFVLGPLVEIAPDAFHPKLRRTAVELLAKLGESAGRDPHSLLGKKAVVTGSSSGIGRAIALALADRGADLLLHARSARPKLEEARELIRLRGVGCYLITADLRDHLAPTRLVDHAWETLGHVDIWVNNAGADILTGVNLGLSFSQKLQELLAVDVVATMLLGREAGKRMQEAGGGVILNMGWDQAETGMEGDSGQLFAATKGAVMAFTKSLALSLAPQVRVNCLAPGWIRTAWGESASSHWQERAEREAPLKRWGTPEDVAGVAAWLASPAAAFVTGQVIRINGGAVR